MKIFINDAKEDWIVDRLKNEFSVYNPKLFTNEAKDADIMDIFLLSSLLMVLVSLVNLLLWCHKI